MIYPKCKYCIYKNYSVWNIYQIIFLQNIFSYFDGMFVFT